MGRWQFAFASHDVLATVQHASSQPRSSLLRCALQMALTRPPARQADASSVDRAAQCRDTHVWIDAVEDCHCRREYEVLLRKVLGFKKKPAAIALYWFSTQGHTFYNNAQDDLDILARCASCEKPSGLATQHNVSLPGFVDAVHERTDVRACSGLSASTSSACYPRRSSAGGAAGTTASRL